MSSQAMTLAAANEAIMRAQGSVPRESLAQLAGDGAVVKIAVLGSGLGALVGAAVGRNLALAPLNTQHVPGHMSRTVLLWQPER